MAIRLPPALLIQGTADDNVTPDMADKFAAAYAKAGGPITLRKFEGEPHTFVSANPAGAASVEALRLITDFIREPDLVDAAISRHAFNPRRSIPRCCTGP